MNDKLLLLLHMLALVAGVPMASGHNVFGRELWKHGKPWKHEHLFPGLCPSVSAVGSSLRPPTLHIAGWNRLRNRLHKTVDTSFVIVLPIMQSIAEI